MICTHVINKGGRGIDLISLYMPYLSRIRIRAFIDIFYLNTYKLREGLDKKNKYNSIYTVKINRDCKFISTDKPMFSGGMNYEKKMYRSKHIVGVVHITSRLGRRDRELSWTEEAN